MSKYLSCPAGLKHQTNSRKKSKFKKTFEHRNPIWKCCESCLLIHDTDLSFDHDDINHWIN